MIQQPWLQPQMKLAQGNQMKITISWGKNDTLDSGISKYLQGGFLGEFSGGLNEYICKVQWGTILGDDPPEHCFVLRNLVPMNFFKYVMIVLLKRQASCRLFDKIYLKAIKTFFFFHYLIFDQGAGGLNFLVGVIFNRREKFKLFGFQGESPPSKKKRKVLLLSGTS